MPLYTLDIEVMQPVLETDCETWADWLELPDRLLLLSEGHSASQVWRLETFFIGLSLDTVPGGPYFFATQYSVGADLELLKEVAYPQLSRTYEEACSTHENATAKLRAPYLFRQTPDKG
jgi:hypothetical protein